ncbi:MAG TPA: GTPase ObgE [Patescibacteria group bacterium]|nr:GTPase ObgE [Patescibacteria group bacterium]
MFVDKVKVSVQAGNGGDGIVSFRHEIFIKKGGPDGGNGGKGGSVVFVASSNQDTLAAFRYKKLLKAEDGQNGGSARKQGGSGKNLIVLVPVGTAVMDEQGKTIVDLVADEQKFVMAAGGNGGFGNAHFVSSTRQAPQVAEKGEKEEKLDLILELRMLADVGLIGLPNAGKSSFLTAVSNAMPEIADYPFTTLKPHLGVVDIDGQAFLLADLPGLIEGASTGKGLGDEFLRHVSRCSVLMHLIDINSNDIAADYKTIRQELAAYSSDMAKKPELIALTKIETIEPDLIDMQLELLKPALPKKAKVFKVSSYAKRGINEILFELKKMVIAEKVVKGSDKQTEYSIPVIRLKEIPNAWTVKKIDNGFLVAGKKIEKFAERTDFNSDFGVQRLRDIMLKMGIMNQLKHEGIDSGDKIVIGNPTKGEIIY